MKIISIVLFILGVTAAHYAEDCLTLCKDSNPLEEWEEEGYAPNLFMLHKLCPGTLEFLDCRMKEMQTCLGQSFEELAASTNLSIAAFSRVILATDNLIRQVCDDTSSLRRDYARNIDCFKGYYFVIKQFCIKDRKRLENLYLGTLLNETEEEIGCKVKLFSGPYEIACTTDLVGKACGAAAKRLYFTASLMFKDIFLVDCDYIDQNWKDDYLNFLLGIKKREFEEVYDEFFKSSDKFVE